MSRDELPVLAFPSDVDTATTTEARRAASSWAHQDDKITYECDVCNSKGTAVAGALPAGWIHRHVNRIGSIFTCSYKCMKLSIQAIKETFAEAAETVE